MVRVLFAGFVFFAKPTINQFSHLYNGIKHNASIYYCQKTVQMGHHNLKNMGILLFFEFMTYVTSWASNIAFLLDWAQMSDLDFGLIQQNISNK